MGVLEKYKLSLREKTALCSGGSSWSTYEIKEKGIPGIVMTDGTYGVRYCKPGEECIDGVEAMSVVELNLNSDSAQLEKYYRATCFPSPSGFACSWDRVLLEEMARYIGQECGALGVDMLLAPAINIRRDPRGGRGLCVLRHRRGAGRNFRHLPDSDLHELFYYVCEYRHAD